MVDPFTAVTLDDLTLGELAVIEELTDWGFGEILVGMSGAGVSSPMFVLALTFVANQRVDPSYTLDDARNTTWLDLQKVIDGAEA